MAFNVTLPRLVIVADPERSPPNVIVKSAGSICTSLSVTVVTIPLPPVNVSVSLIRDTPSVPVSPAIFNVVATDTEPAAVSRPC